MHHRQNRHLFPVAYISVELGCVTAFLYATNLCARRVEPEKTETRLDSLRVESSFKNQARRSNSIESSTTLSSTNRVELKGGLDSSSQLGSKLDSARLGAMSEQQELHDLDVRLRKATETVLEQQRRGERSTLVPHAQISAERRELVKSMKEAETAAKAPEPKPPAFQRARRIIRLPAKYR